MHRVLVTDGEQRSTLAVVRSLGKAGHDVEVCAVTSRSLAGASRWAAAEHTVPDPESDPGAFSEALVRLVGSRQATVLIPMTDVSISVTLALRGRLPGLIMPFPDQVTWEAASDKRHLMEVARSIGVPVPRQCVIDTRDDDATLALEWARSTGYPVVLKPHRSATVSPDGILRTEVRLIRTDDELVSGLRSMDELAFPVMVQEHISGPGLGAFFLSDGGRIVASFAHRRIREKPPTGGVSVLRESVELREDLRRHSEALLGALGWSGVSMVEFKEDSTSGIPYLMEINGRFWGSLQLAIDSGVDFPALLLDQFVGSDSLKSFTYRVGRRSRWFWGDVDHLLWIFRNSSAYRVAYPELPGPLKGLLQFASPWRPGQRCEVFRMNDPSPFIRESRLWLGDVLRIRRSR